MLTISNRSIIDFYKNKQKDEFEKNNIMLIDMIEKIIDNNNNDTNSNNAIIQFKQMTEFVTEKLGIFENKLQDIGLSNIKEQITNLQQKISDRDNEIKQINEIRTIVQPMNDNIIQSIKDNNTLNNKLDIESISQKISDGNKIIENSISKTFTDNNNNQTGALSNEIKKIKQETDKILSIKENADNSPIIISAIKDHQDKIQNALTVFTTNYENERRTLQEQYNNTVSNKNELLFEQIKNHFSLSFDKINTFVDKNTTDNSSIKGGASEDRLEVILSTCLPSSIIQRTSNLTSSGDFIVNFNNIKILVENKCYSTNVKKEEVQKFITDTRKQQAHGIFFSQTSGISSKENFDIQIDDNNVLLYVHNVNYQENIVIAAFKLIESINIQRENLKKDGRNISQDNYDLIRKEFLDFIASKKNIIFSLNAILTDIKEKILKELNDFKFPISLNYFEVTSSDDKKKYTCEFPGCGLCFATKAGLGGHKKVHRNQDPSANIIINN